MSTNECPNCGYSDEYLNLVDWPYVCNGNEKRCKHWYKGWCSLHCVLDDIARYLCYTRCHDEKIPFLKGTPIQFAEELTQIVKQILEVSKKTRNAHIEIDKYNEMKEPKK